MNGFWVIFWGVVGILGLCFVARFITTIASATGRVCPACLSEVPQAARKCKHCGEGLPEKG